MAVVWGSFRKNNKMALAIFHKILCRPRLEYGNLMWALFNRADQSLVEAGWPAARLVRPIQNPPYSERLRFLAIVPVETRRYGPSVLDIPLCSEPESNPAFLNVIQTSEPEDFR